MLRKHVILAVFKRNLASYFSGVLGYLFIVVFVVSGAIAAFNPQFFTNNLANLDQLTEYFPMLLLFIVPAITMSTWADEKKLGTDELLFTLPASIVEILLGKYLAVLTVYAVTLLFSLTHLAVLGYYADPDWGLLATTFFGYFVSGAALLSAGMFASVLTSSTTVAFVVGAVICAVPVFIGKIATGNEFVQQLSLSEQFREFGMGTVPLGGLLYFISLTVLMLYLNLIFISKRHWSSGGQGVYLGWQFAVRAVSLLAILISVNVVAAKTGGVVNLNYDMTAEQIFSLSPTTRELVKNIEKKSPVTISAYISPDVPREIVVHQKRLTGLLRQYDRIGGARIDVRFVEVEDRYSKEAEEAALFGIEPVSIGTDRGGRHAQEDVFLGAVISSPLDEVVIRFFDIGIPIEYELTRSIRTVSKEKRLTVGILRTDARVNGGMEMSTFRNLPEWLIKAELKKQYNVEDVGPDAPIDESKYDVVLAILPSTMTQPQMQNFVDYVKKGKPVLIFDDPLPVYDGGQSAPRQQKPRPGGMFGGGRQPPQQKADGGKATSLMDALDVSWDNGGIQDGWPEVLWDVTGMSLHPEFAEVIRPELVFVSATSKTKNVFNPTSKITKGLQEILTFFPGSIRPRQGSNHKFEPLLRTSVQSGLLEWDEITESGGFFMSGVQIKPNPDRIIDRDAHVLAAHVTSKKKDAGVNAIYVCDVDIIANQLFNIVKGELYGLKLDNVKFVLNAVDILAGDDSYVELRNRRPVHRTLTEVQKRADKFRQQRQDEVQKAKRKADEALESNQERLRKEIEKIEKDQTLTPQEKQQALKIAQERQQRILDVQRANIERDRKKTEEQIKAREQRQIRALENEIRFWATALPPLPAVLLGIILLSMRLNTERREIETSRLVE